VSYEPREFWERRLREQFDLRGTGETGLSLAYNRACYALRRIQLERVLRDEGAELAGRQVLDVGCGTGFFTDFYLRHGARVTGLDITEASVAGLRTRFPHASFVLADVSDTAPAGRFDVVNAFDVLYHITDDARWSRAVRHLADAVAPGGIILITDVFDRADTQAEHNVVRPLSAYRAILESSGLVLGGLTPTHVLLNRALGVWRFLNRLPWLLYAVDRTLLAAGYSLPRRTNRILVARRPR
jgi:2-polyprenyl-3-methyl-5-hydroxy-6-metoxy-1,4-benzoquinol methylase